MYDITTVGTTTIDTFLELEDIYYHKTNNGKKYYCLPVGAKVPVQKSEKHFGGNAANIAVGLSRLKLTPAIITSLGECASCQAVINNLKHENVATTSIKISRKCEKGEVNTAYILDWKKDKRDRVILSYHQPKDFKNIQWPKTEWLYLSSLSEYCSAICSKLPSSLRIAFTPGGYELERGLPLLLPILKKTEILIVNRNEAGQLLNIDDKTADIEFLMTHLLKLGAKVVAMTAGKNGAYAYDRKSKEPLFERTLEVPIEEVTGAGDAFSSGFVAAYIKKKTLRECLRWGILNATACIQKIGAQNGLLSLGQMHQRYKRYYG